ncbi:PE-PPE domain-containing protein [[Mycobacterium] wendilense]|uniref:PE-PPE domain-containing protein n=1 Tax=[Mycobacterium] wendilense TaxID=3064284 RepID=A0ABM9MJ61_9MYCO|nr:PE-PPE domain-containing protein [Mycolicibacterium sp. MU0050]CAJ1586495.1 PE-PPE domain-containing protein [Mycolicibacterium sp. MU0050]
MDVAPNRYGNRAERRAAKRRGATRPAVTAAVTAAAAVSVALAPAFTADAGTYVVGMPDWLSGVVGGAVNTLPSDPDAVSGAIQQDRANAIKLVGWGTGGFSEEDLAPRWVTWVDPTRAANPVTQSGGLFGPWTGTVTGRAWANGQWVSPSDPGVDLTNISVGDLLKYNSYSAQVGGIDKAVATALAPYLNWTAYLSNTNFIGYGDGAVAVGQGYQDFIDLARTPGGLEVGPALTGPRKIVITDPNDPVTKDVTKAFVKVNYVTYLAIQAAPGVWLATQPLNAGDYPDQPDLPAVEITPAGVIDVTVLTVNLLRNPGRPNGGLYSRFAPIYQEVTGVNPVTPERQDVLPEGADLAGLVDENGNLNLAGLDFENGDLLATLEGLDGKPIVLTLLKTDFTWEYDLLSDAPATASPVAWANSAMSALLPLTLGASLLNLDQGAPGLELYQSPDGTIYGTLTQEQLPLLAPARLVSGLIGLATGEDVNTPVADALEPFLKLLVDTSYTDVVRNADGTWDRTHDQAHIATLFGTQTITRTQATLLAGDLIAELGKGVGSEYTDVVQRLNRVVSFLEDNDFEVPAEIKAAAARLAAEPGAAIQRVSRDLGTTVSEVLGEVDRVLPETPPPTQAQLANGQRPVGKALGAVKDGVDAGTVQVHGAIDDAAEAIGQVEGLESSAQQAAAALKDPAGALKKAGAKAQADLTKRVTKTQKSLAKSQARAKAVTDKLKDGDLSGAVKQVGANVENRVKRVQKDIKNGVDKVKAKVKSSGGAESDE